MPFRCVIINYLQLSLKKIVLCIKVSIYLFHDLGYTSYILYISLFCTVYKSMEKNQMYEHKSTHNKMPFNAPLNNTSKIHMQCLLCMDKNNNKKFKTFNNKLVTTLHDLQLTRHQALSHLHFSLRFLFLNVQLPIYLY